MALSPGTRLGPYEIVAPLGAGGMGEVYRARDGKLGRDIAVKILPADFAADPERLKRFEQEARAASSLNHPNIVHVYDVDAAGSLHYIAMELVEGRSLRELLASGPLPARKLLDVAIEIGDGLAKAHGAGIVHRDLKPENLLVTSEGHVKILDFGLAKLLEAGSADPAERSTSPKLESRSGAIVGTVGYMSPEQAAGKAVDFRSDQFSFGVLLYEMAAGRRPFKGGSAPETLAAILRDPPEPLSQASAGVPLALRRIVEERCLAKDPLERYASTWDLVRDLHSVRDHLSDMPAPTAFPAAPPRRRRRGRGVLAAVALVLALAAGYVAGRRSLPNPAPPRFRQITFGRGIIWSARFAPDGETILYGAAWDGRPVEPFQTRLGGPESRGLGFPGAELLAVSLSGELAISLERRYLSGWQFSGTLARVALAGGSPRPVLEDVQYADWSPDGKSLAIVREVGGKTRLEYPIGTVLYETAGWISHPRVSLQGDRVAFLDHPAQGDDRGAVAVVDRSGRRRTLTDEWASEQGLAWSPTGGEVWFTATTSGSARALHAVTLDGIERTVTAIPGRLTLHDISREGRVLLARDPARIGIRGLLPGSDLERDVSALDSSIPRDLSADGGTLLIHEQGEGAPADYAIYLRRTETNSPPVLLGEGSPLSLSPDGRWVLALLVSRRGQLLLVPTGAGDVRRLPDTGLGYQTWGAFLPDGKRIVCLANEPGRAVRLWVQEVEAGHPRAFSPEGVTLPIGTQPVSPDGALVAAIGPDKRATVYSVGGGEPRVLAGVEAGEVPTRFTSDGRELFVFRRGELPARIFKVDLATGRRSLWKQIAPTDPAGLASGILRFLPTPDGRFYVYSATRILSELYVAEGLR